MTYIFVKLFGGLGNQLFQYAAGFLQQKVTHGKLFFTETNNNHDATDYRITFGLEKYNTDLPIHNVVIQPNGSFSSWNPNDYHDTIIVLYGYFQNYNVLKSILPEFRSNILYKLKSQREILLYKYNILPNSGFIHIRRGDYISGNFNIIGLSYYANAIDLLSEIDNWYIFSDDMAWVKKQDIFLQLDPIFVDESEPLMALILMSQITDGAILGNSTFSWWGAYLGDNKSVIYPKIWINKEGETTDLFPEKWIGI